MNKKDQIGSRMIEKEQKGTKMNKKVSELKKTFSNDLEDIEKFNEELLRSSWIELEPEVSSKIKHEYEWSFLNKLELKISELIYEDFIRSLYFNYDTEEFFKIYTDTEGNLKINELLKDIREFIKEYLCNDLLK